jgi:hypothetical protein
MLVPTPPGLECLLDLACRDGVDIRPTLLRVLTDLYVQKRSHTAEEEHHYVELAQRLIQTVDAKTRAAVSTRLRDYRMIPPQLLPYLTPQGSPSDLSDIVAASAAAALPASATAPATEKAVLIPADAPALVPAASAHDEPVTATHPQQQPTAAELCELFFTAPPQDRRLILIHLDAVAGANTETPPASDHVATIRTLEMAALRRDRPGFAREVVRVMNIDIRMATRIVDDATGEPLLIPARLVEMPESVLQRVLLFLNPVVGRSVQRVFELSALYGQFTGPAARQMASIMRAAATTPIGAQPARYDAALWPETAARLRSAAQNYPARRREASPDFVNLPPPFRIGER